MTVLRTSRQARLAIAISIVVAGCGGIFVCCSDLLQAQPPSESQITYSLRHTSAADIHSRLRTALPADSGAVDIGVDSANNRLVIRAAGQTQQLAGELVAALDQPAATEPAGQTPQATATVKVYSIPPGRLEAVAAAVQQAYPSGSGVRVVPDPRTGQLLIVAPLDLQQAIAQQIERERGGKVAVEIASPAPGQSAQPADAAVSSGTEGQLRLRHIGWQQLEEGLKQLLGGSLAVNAAGDGQQAVITLPAQADQKVQLRVDRASGVIAASGPPKAVEAWLEVIGAMDNPQPAAGQGTKLVALRRAKRANVRYALSLLQDGRGDGAGNTIEVTRLAPATDAALVSRLFQDEAPAAAAQPGQPAPPPDGPPSGEGTAAAVAGALEGGGLIGQVQVEYLEGSDVIVIRGRQEDVQRVIEIINQIEIYTKETEPEVRIVPLEHVNSSSVATLVNQLYTDVYSVRQGTVSITALVKPNAVLLIGRPESVSVALGLIQKLDRPVIPETQFHVIRLEHISATEAQTMLQEFFGEVPEAGQAGQAAQAATTTGLATRVRITADARSNSLIIQASPRDLLEVQRLVQQVDVATSKVVNRVEVFQLRNARADELAPVLQQAISGAQGRTTGTTGTGGALPGQVVPGATGMGTGGRGTQATQTRSAMLTLTQVGPEGEQVLRSGIMRDVTINADTATNSLIVTAPDQAMGLIAALIQRLDQLPTSEAQIKVFTLQNGDATDVREMLDEMFGQTATQQGLQAGGFAFGETSLVPLRFSVDVRTNSIIASGSPVDLAVVRAVILRLDGSNVRERKNLVYHLRYTEAPDVAAAIQEFLQAEQQRTQQQISQLVQGQLGLSPFEQIQREVVVVAEALSNSLIVSATPRFYDEIVQIITDIDSIPPMVMIQVLIAQITHGENDQFGVELGLQDSLLFERGSVLGSPAAILQSDITSGENVAAQGLTDLSLGRRDTLNNLGFGGLVFAAGSESVNILIRALQQRSRVDLLARPEIMTLDNIAARIQLGSDVRLPSGTVISDTGLTNLETEARSVGIILDVLPRISPDGTVTMLISAERSALDQSQGTPIGVDGNGNQIISPNVNLATALTTISVRSGQTAVWGGLLTHDTTTLTRGVPFLSDLPLLGNAFRFDGVQDERKELLIVLTPHVLRSADDVERISAIEASRMSWCLADVVRMHGDPGLAHQQSFWQQSDIPTEYPDGMPAEPEPAADSDLDSPPALRLPKLPKNSLSKAMRRWTGSKSDRQTAHRGSEQAELATQRRPVGPLGSGTELPYVAPGSVNQEYGIETTNYQEPNRAARATNGHQGDGLTRLPQVP